MIFASRPLPSQLSFRYSYKDCFFFEKSSRCFRDVSWELGHETKESGHVGRSLLFFGMYSWAITIFKWVLPFLWRPQLFLVDLVSSCDSRPGRGDGGFDLMPNFPNFMKNIARKPAFYYDVERLLHVKEAGAAINGDLFGSLQDRFLFHLEENLEEDVRVEAAKLATGVIVCDCWLI